MNAPDPLKNLQHATQEAISQQQHRLSQVQAFQQELAQLPDGNAPLGECKKLLNSHGFCVLSRDEVRALEAVVNHDLASSDFETQDEEATVQALLRSLQDELRCCW